MPFQVDLIFAGLCADVLDRPREEGPSELTVLMPTANTVNDTFNGRKIAVHLPVAILAAKDAGQGQGTLLHDLSSREVRLDAAFAGSAQPLTLELDGNSDSYSHVLQMKSIAPRFSKVKPECLLASPPAALLAARVHLSAGEVNSFELRSSLQTFPPSTWGAQKVAHRVRCRLSNLNSLTLRASRFDDPADVLEIPIQPADGTSARVVLGNLCDDDLLEFLGGPSPGAGVGKQVDLDFAAYYRLAKEDASMEPSFSLPLPQAPVGAAGKTRCNRVELEP